MKRHKEKIFDLIDKLKLMIKDRFIASDTDPESVRKKHKRVGLLFLFIFVTFILGIVVLGNSLDNNKTSENSNSAVINQDRKKFDISKLATGITNEQIWLEGAEKELLELKQQQYLNSEEQDKLKEYVNNDTVNKEELTQILRQLESDIEKKYAKELESQINAIKQTQLQAPQESPIEILHSKPKAKIKKIGDYIPAGSYVEASLISGVDAGIGISAEADPRQVLLRVTGKAISAGYGKDYLTTDVLMGCLVQCQALGDLSSEKVYLKPVVMTCAKSGNAVIEMLVKGYVTASGKSGIRGEVVSREGDLVAKSFFAGLLGGVGSGVSQFYQPNFGLSGGVAVKQLEQVQNIIGTGFGSGISQSTGKLSDYLIRRAEQYQPVISILEGTKVNLVFQEGFSLSEEEIKNANS
jgi:conjugal transfer pilus assembly protein TraB